MTPPAAAASAVLGAPPRAGGGSPKRRPLSDEALARRAGQGDEEAFATLYARYGSRLAAYCRSILRHDEDARDAVQIAMTNAYVAPPRQRNVVVRPWLFRIAHNAAISLLRGRRPVAELTDVVPDQRLDPYGSMMLREELNAPLRSIDALPDRLAHPLPLRELRAWATTRWAPCSAPIPMRRARRSSRRGPRSGSSARHATDCASIRQTLSDGDGRRRRGRRVRSHLRGCAACREWDRAQRGRRVGSRRCRSVAYRPARCGAGSRVSWAPAMSRSSLR